MSKRNDRLRLVQYPTGLSEQVEFLAGRVAVRKEIGDRRVEQGSDVPQATSARWSAGRWRDPGGTKNETGRGGLQLDSRPNATPYDDRAVIETRGT